MRVSEKNRAMNNNRVLKQTAMILIMLLIMGVLAVVCAILPARDSVSTETAAIRSVIDKTGRIIHAGGFVQTADAGIARYTNSYEALVNMYEHGNRVCEIDIRETGDGILVCAHGDEEYLADGMNLPKDATEAEFLSQKLFGSLQPMNVQMLAQFMRDHEDLLVITDIRGDVVEICGKLAREYPDLRNRFIVQIYHEAEYTPVKRIGFPHIIYTLYRAEDNERNLWEIAHFAQRHELVGVTIQYEQFYNWKNRIAMNHCGTPFMFHTVNDEIEIAQMLAKPFVLGVYTDITD